MGSAVGTVVRLSVPALVLAALALALFAAAAEGPLTALGIAQPDFYHSVEFLPPGAADRADAVYVSRRVGRLLNIGKYGPLWLAIAAFLLAGAAQILRDSDLCSTHDERSDLPPLRVLEFMARLPFGPLAGPLVGLATAFSLLAISTGMSDQIEARYWRFAAHPLSLILICAAAVAAVSKKIEEAEAAVIESAAASMSYGESAAAEPAKAAMSEGAPAIEPPAESETAPVVAGEAG